MMYYYGQGMPRDHLEAARWFKRAASQGDQEAANYLKQVEKGLVSEEHQTVA
jgi:TPR repeat protein